MASTSSCAALVIGASAGIGVSPAYVSCKGAMASLTYDLAALYGGWSRMQMPPEITRVVIDGTRNR